MTKAEFIKNNRGINDDADLPEEVLSGIYDEIHSNEIRMKDEIESAVPLPAAGPGLAGALANVGRDLQMEAYVVQTNNMANKTEVRSCSWAKKRSLTNLIILGFVQNTHAVAAQRIAVQWAVLQCISLRTRETNVRSCLDLVSSRFIRPYAGDR